MTPPGAAPVATYRVQLTPANDLARVTAGLDHLVRLGISHVYLSPVTEAVPGSTHGYDVVDHTRVRDELGGLDGLIELLDAAHRRDLSVLIDHVANHVSVSRPELNTPWWAMLAEGPGGDAARWFDVDWAAYGGKALLPVLGESPESSLEGGRFEITEGGDGAELRLDDGRRWPLAAGTAVLPVGEALRRQHYELIHWRRAERNVRRFFTIDDLVAVRVEHPEVARAVDTVPRLLVDHPAFAGVRVDHVDGLADPAAYLTGLRELIGDGRWLLVEKILAPGEALPSGWPVDGTTGYEHIRVVDHALADRAAVAAMTERWRALVGDDRPFGQWQRAARREVLGHGLRPDLDRVVAAGRSAGLDAPDLADAVTELSVDLARYRTYLPGDGASSAALDDAAERAVGHRPELAHTVEWLAATLRSPGTDAEAQLLTRWQQLTGPTMAKGVEDRAFFRYVPVSWLCEVGGDPAPAPPADAVAELHDHHRTVARRWPTTLLAGTTHDTKRSEDVHAGGLALLDHPTTWDDVIAGWFDGPSAEHTAVDASTQWLALQTATIAGPISAGRLGAFLVKCAREADVHTSWTDPDDGYERALGRLAAQLSEPGALPDLTCVRESSRERSLGMLTIRCTAPGVPDIYQGTELRRSLLVDPDNRTEPDHESLERVVAMAARLDLPAALAGDAAGARAVVITRLLTLRRVLPEAFGAGSGYSLVEARGDHAGRLVAYARLDHRDRARVIVAVPTASGGIGADGIDARVVLPGGEWHHVLVDGMPAARGRVELGPAFARAPVLVLAQPAG